jgi:hypothetical protein
MREAMTVAADDPRRRHRVIGEWAEMVQFERQPGPAAGFAAASSLPNATRSLPCRRAGDRD